MATIFASDDFHLSKGMKIALIASALFHVSVIIIGMLGFPYISKPPMLPPVPIAIEMVDVSEMPTTNRTPVKTRPKPEEEKEPPKTVKKVEAPPKVEAKEPPKIKPIEKPKEKAEAPPKPKVPPPPAEKLDKPKTPEKKEVAEAVEEQVDPLESLMKNLQESEEAVEGTEEGTAKPDAAPDAPIAETMSNHELGALTNQLVGCWDIPIGAKDVHSMVVTVHIWPNDDRSVKKVEIQDQWRMGNDSAFRALAESARRAVWNPRCSPLELPLEKIKVWKGKYIVVDFDPRYVT